MLDDILFFEMIGDYRVTIEYSFEHKIYFASSWDVDKFTGKRLCLIQAYGHSYQNVCEEFLISVVEYSLMD
jgi:hypothetical protein